jgi:hypothetical protein
MSLTIARFQKPNATGNIQNKGAFGYTLIGILVSACAGLFFAHAGKLLNLGFPVLATITATLLFRLHRNAYVAFALWIWIFTPEVRRLVDYQSTYHSVSPVMVTPLLVNGLVFLTIFQRPRFLLYRFMLPFHLFVAAAFLSFATGIFESGYLPAAFDFCGLICPLAFGVFLIMDQHESERNRNAIVFASLTGLILIGAYGLYQFYHLPPWDAFWLSQSKFSSAGSSFAEQVRIFGPLNSPGPYGAVLMAFLVFVLATRGRLRIPAAALGLPALALSGVRAAWGGLAIGALLVIWRLGGKARLRFIVFALVVAAITMPLLTEGTFASVVSKRFSSLSNIQQDQSFQAREGLYETFASKAFSQPIGAGLGQLGVAAKLTTGEPIDFDSGVLEIPYEFGWVGGMLIVCSITLISLRIFKILASSQDYITVGAGAIFFSVLSTIISGPVFGGLNGMLLWTAAGLVVRARLNEGK